MRRGICKNFEAVPVFYNIPGDNENRSCVVRCNVPSNSFYEMKTQKLKYKEYALPDGVPCGSSNNLSYCVRGRCEVSTIISRHLRKILDYYIEDVFDITLEISNSFSI